MLSSCKPHTQGNEYNIICSGESGIIDSWEIVEVSNLPITMGIPEFESSPNMKTFGLILRLTRYIRGTDKEVITDSSLCFLKGILEMRKRRVY